MKIYVKKVDGLILPKQGTPHSTGYDVIATSDPKIVGDAVGMHWHSIAYIQYETNLFVAPETQTHDIKIYPRSSISKYNLSLANSVPIIDNDYRGMILLRFKYLWQPEDFEVRDYYIVGGINNEDKIYKKGDAIAQLTVSSVIPVEFVVVDDLTQTQRGEGGFGSTDLQKQSKDIPKGKTLMEVFAESGGGGAPVPYSEQIKKRDIL